MKRRALDAAYEEHATEGIGRITSRAILTLLAGMLALVLVAGVAWATTVQCQARVQECFGTPDPDTITGTSGQDSVRALAGADLARGMGDADIVTGGRGKDTVEGGAGPDPFLWGGESGPKHQGPFTDASDDHVYGGQVATTSSAAMPRVGRISSMARRTTTTSRPTSVVAPRNSG